MKSNWEKTAFSVENFESENSLYALEVNAAKSFYSGVYQNALAPKAVAQKIVFLKHESKNQGSLFDRLKNPIIASVV